MAASLPYTWVAYSKGRKEKKSVVHSHARRASELDKQARRRIAVQRVTPLPIKPLCLPQKEAVHLQDPQKMTAIPHAAVSDELKQAQTYDAVQCILIDEEALSLSESSACDIEQVLILQQELSVAGVLLSYVCWTADTQTDRQFVGEAS